MILYFIKANLILALLCLLFQVLMHRDTFFGVRRLMLWGIYLTAFLLPLWNVQTWMNSDVTAGAMAASYAENILPALNVTAMRVAAMGIEQSEPGCGMWFVGTIMLWALIYIIPVAWMTAKLIGQVAYIIYLRCTCPKMKNEGMKNEKYKLPSNLDSNPNCSFGGEADHFSLFTPTIFLFPRPCSPFSFGPWIFIHPDGMDEQTLREVLIHEQTHVRQWHTLDVLFSQLVCILFWWNPATWVMRREVRLNLEFIADAAVIGRQANKREYQYRLLGFTTQKNVATIANNFNVLPLKRRISMMNSRRTSRTGMLKYILFVPLAAALLLASNVDALARTIADKAKNPLVIVDDQRSDLAQLQQVVPEQIDHITVFTAETATQVYGEEAKDGAILIETKQSAPDDNIYDNVEVMPEFPGGQEALYTEMYTRVKYPAAAQENGVQGRVMVSFVVEKDGTLSDVRATEVCDSAGHKLSEMVVTAYKPEMTPEEAEQAKQQEQLINGMKALGKESERVVKLLPRWKPGQQKGQPVRVSYVMPVVFKLL